MSDHLMIDIEALSLRPGAAIIQLGAVRFDLSGRVYGTFFLPVVPAAPFTADLDTLKWHAEQGTVYPGEGAVSGPEAIRQFCQWLARDGRAVEHVWAWGSTYDMPILDLYFDLKPDGLERPWNYSAVRDARTVWKLAYGKKRPADRPHNALADAVAAVEDLCRAHAKLSAEGWVPIDSAPKDGTVIRIYAPSLVHEDYNPSGCADGSWQDSHEVGEPEGFVVAIWSSDADSYMPAHVNDATHWQRHPAPPALMGKEVPA